MAKKENDETITAKDPAENIKILKKEKKARALIQKREKRKLIRKEKGQYKANVKIGPEEMRKKIDEIQSRETITKTAKRKLRILKKVLSIAEGTSPPVPLKTENVKKETAKPNKNEKKKLKPEKFKLQSADKNQKSTLGVTNKQNPIKQEKRKLDKKSNLVNLKNKKIVQKAGNKKFSMKREEEDDRTESEDEASEEVDTQNNQLRNKKLLIMKKLVEGEKDDEEEDDEDDEEDTEIEDDEEDKDGGESEDDEVDVEDEEDEEDEEHQENDEDDDEGDEEDEDNEESEEDEKEEDEPASKKFKKNIEKKSPIQKIENEAREDTKMSLQNICNQENGGKKKRYVLFVGNIPYKATVEDITNHFLQKVSEVVSVRIPTVKGSKKPRGFAYIEVSNNVDYEKALSLHQSTIQGFKINVQFTQTGSKNIKNKQEIVAKNKKLHAMRKAGKLAGSKKESQKRSFRRNFKNKQQGRPG